MSNAPEMFRIAMTTVGIELAGQIYADGKLHRFKADGDDARNSWYVLYAGPPAAGAFGCWKRNFKQTWCERNGRLSPEDSQRIRQRWREAKATLKAETSARQNRARHIADRILQLAQPVTAHPYLTTKQIQAYGELCGYHGMLVMPLRDINGKLHSLQFIAANGSKKFLPGGRVVGCFFTLADRADRPVVLCEGYATGASIHQATGHSVICAMYCGNLLDVAKAVRELWSQREVIIAADNDAFTDGNPGLTKATAAAMAIRAKIAVPQSDKIIGAIDFNDLATAEGLPAITKQIDAAEIPSERDGDAFGRLAALAPAEYDRCRESEATALGIRVTTLDAEVERLRRRTGADDSTLQGCAIDLPEVEPWPQPVDGVELLNAVSNNFLRYSALPPGAADAMTLWAAHSHCFEAFNFTPRLHITSPEKGCGKTTTLDVLAQIVPRPLATENLTSPVLFRVVEKRKPTVLADECDSWLRNDQELRSLLNAGHRRGGQALRCEGDNHEVRAFRVFGPAVLCGIGTLPGTLHDRSIVIRLERAKIGEIQERFDSRRTDREQELCRKLARWCADNYHRLEACNPEMPDGAFNRLADNWRPFFAIAEVVGGDWPQRAAAAFDKLARRDDSEAQSIGAQLLSDIQEVFAGMWPLSPDGERALSIERIFSRKLVECLYAMNDRPWAEANRGKPITENWLARHLKRFGVHPTTLRIGTDRAKGYKKADFTDAFDRYVADPRDLSRDSVTHDGKSVSKAVTNDPIVTDAKRRSPEEMSRRHACEAPPIDPQRSAEPTLQVIEEDALLL